MSNLDIQIPRATIKSLILNNLESQKVTVIHHSDPTLCGISGTVIGDHANVLRIDVSGSVITVSKSDGVFGFTVDQAMLQIDGHLIQGSMKKRRKRKLRTW